MKYTNTLTTNQEQIQEILKDLEIIKDKLYNINFNDYKKDSQFSFSIDQINPLISHLKTFIEMGE
jgi:hypothetical protein